MKNGWEIIPLGQICSIKSGKSDTKDAVEDGAYAFFDRSRTIKKSSRYLFDCEALIIPGEGTEFLPKHFIGKFDLHQRAYALFDFSDRIDVKFLYYFLHHLCDYFPRVAVGATVKSLRLRHFEQLPVSVTSLSEQQRIVGILDEAFESIAIAKANAEKNLQNARALFESHLQSVFTQRPVSGVERRGKGRVETTLGEEIDLLAGFAFKSAQYTDSEDSVRLLRGDNIIQSSLRWDDVKKWPASDTSEYGRYQLREGDVVLAMDRPWIKAGLKHAMISALDLPCLLVQRTARLRCGPRINKRFLMYLIGCSEFTQHIIGIQTGIGVPHISGQQIKDFTFLRPPFEEQCRIADNLDGLRTKTQRLAILYERKLAALEALKKSLLHRAFSGGL
ncbi:MAG: restriction endonuclease subunit S [Candidatus Sumerlaeota bacterium]|nr:restriction endonuclease subunit S [Candidatus Sumerlaeota bacterium]